MFPLFFVVHNIPTLFLNNIFFASIIFLEFAGMSDSTQIQILKKNLNKKTLYKYCFWESHIPWICPPIIKHIVFYYQLLITQPTVFSIQFTIRNIFILHNITRAVKCVKPKCLAAGTCPRKSPTVKRIVRSLSF